jgi:two-component system, chemotaxis family, chemotaxis protein CheY
MAVILAVDDSETMQKMVRQTLESNKHTVFVASDGVIGLDVFKANKFDLIVTDINMPNMDGLTFIKEVRKLDDKIPILTLTTEKEDDMRQKGKDAGANGWIVKPFRPAQFIAIVKQILE